VGCLFDAGLAAFSQESKKWLKYCRKGEVQKRGTLPIGQKMFVKANSLKK
jgi:hypothetical protein